jgi:hypothetical protein
LGEVTALLEQTTTNPLCVLYDTLNGTFYTPSIQYAGACGYCACRGLPILIANRHYFQQESTVLSLFQSQFYVFYGLQASRGFLGINQWQTRKLQWNFPSKIYGPSVTGRVITRVLRSARTAIDSTQTLTYQLGA